MDELIDRTAEYVRKRMQNEATGHDWWHIQRVWNTAKDIASSYPKANRRLIELSALLHDLGDYKITGSSEKEEKVLRQAMKDLNFEDTLIEHVLETIDKVSFSKNVGENEDLTIEAQIVQDADRLDALGAIGIARVFAYGGKTGKPIYDPTQKPQVFRTTEERRSSRGSSVLHFDEKLFLLKDLLNTKEAKKIGEMRHLFMEDFLKEFHQEWDGQK